MAPQQGRDEKQKDRAGDRCGVVTRCPERSVRRGDNQCPDNEQGEGHSNGLLGVAVSGSPTLHVAERIISRRPIRSHQRIGPFA
jgi:hypothetical protein